MAMCPDSSNVLFAGMGHWTEDALERASPYDTAISLEWGLEDQDDRRSELNTKTTTRVPTHEELGGDCGLAIQGVQNGGRRAGDDGLENDISGKRGEPCAQLTNSGGRKTFFGGNNPTAESQVENRVVAF
ncbi:hypothetical protein AAE478_002267 [Parahypoxylon ruwenzoriense]